MDNGQDLEHDELIQLQQHLCALAKAQAHSNSAGASAYLNSLLQSCRTDALQACWLEATPVDESQDQRQLRLRSALIVAITSKITLFQEHARSIQPANSIVLPTQRTN